jgi:hypothetical protein
MKPRIKPKVARSFKIGDLVKAIPEYSLGSSFTMPELIYPFEGSAVIIELNWPDKAHVLINTGEVMCIMLEKIQAVKEKRK